MFRVLRPLRFGDDEHLTEHEQHHLLHVVLRICDLHGRFIKVLMSMEMSELAIIRLRRP